jgi:hypothetical protein
MGEIRKIKPVKYFVGIIMKDTDIYNITLEKLVEKYGPVDMVSEIIPFNFTEYYLPEMGENLKRQFVAFKNLMDPADLPDVKIFTNELEEQLSETVQGKLHRRINLDPGYLEVAKMILATTKNYIHRIYLRSGIYAEITLRWKKGSFQPLEFTYVDYKSDFYIDYFNRLREFYRQQLEKTDTEHPETK